MIYKKLLIKMIGSGLEDFKAEHESVTVSLQKFPKAGQTWYIRPFVGFDVVPIHFLTRKYANGVFAYSCMLNGRRVELSIGMDGYFTKPFPDKYFNKPYRSLAKARADVNIKLALV